MNYHQHKGEILTHYTHRLSFSHIPLCTARVCWPILPLTSVTCEGFLCFHSMYSWVRGVYYIWHFSVFLRSAHVSWSHCNQCMFSAILLAKARNEIECLYFLYDVGCFNYPLIYSTGIGYIPRTIQKLESGKIKICTDKKIHRISRMSIWGLVLLLLQRRPGNMVHMSIGIQ